MRIPLSTVRFIGEGLMRPECVLAHASGLLIAPDWTAPGGVTLLSPDGAVRRVLATRPGGGVETPVRPNGVALEPGGAVLLAHLGAERGGVYRLQADGTCEVVVDQIDGAPLPPTNFVARDPDESGRLWITVSTTVTPRAADYRPDASSGFIAVVENGVGRIVADQLGYANECLIAPDRRTLYVNETFARRLTAFDLDGDRLANRRVVARFGAGVFPDGLTLLEDGALLVTSIVSNRVIRVAPNGDQEVWLEDADADHVAWVEEAFQSGAMDRPHLDRVVSTTLRNVSNLALGGPARRTAYLGALLGDRIACFDSPVAGVPPTHWTYDIGPLAARRSGADA